MFVGDKDTLSNPKDALQLRDKLGKSSVIEYVTFKNFDHSSFNMFKPDDQYYMDSVIRVLNKYNPTPIVKKVGDYYSDDD